MLTFGSFFAGIGGLDLGLERAGMKCKFQVEIEEDANRILEKRWPDVVRFRDARTIRSQDLPKVEVFAGGFPCQDVSSAGLRAGLAGKRSTLWSEFYELFRCSGARWLLAENVDGIRTASDGRFLGKVLGDLARGGFSAEWQMLPAALFGAHHIRQRFFLVAHRPSELWDGLPLVFGRQKFDQELWCPQLGGLSGKDSFAGWSEPSQFVGRAEMGRMAYGATSGVDAHRARLKALGNAVVPQVGEWLGRQIIEAEKFLAERALK